MVSFYVYLCLFLLIFGNNECQPVNEVDSFTVEEMPDQSALLQDKRIAPKLADDSSSSLNRLWKRLVHDLAIYQRQQRFGNTRYGRNLRE